MFRKPQPSAFFIVFLLIALALQLQPAHANEGGALTLALKSALSAERGQMAVSRAVAQPQIARALAHLLGINDVSTITSNAALARATLLSKLNAEVDPKVHFKVAHLLGLKVETLEIRSQTWPRVAPEMIETLHEVASEAGGVVLRTTDSMEAMKQALAKISPDEVVHAIFGDARLDEVASHFSGLRSYPHKFGKPGAGVIPVSMSGALGHDTRGLRAALAYSIRSIADDELKREWMSFLMKDSDSWVVYHAASSFRFFSVQSERDEFAVRLIQKSSDNGFIALAVANGLSSVSPRLRWKLIKHLSLMGATHGHAIVESAIKAARSFSTLSNPETDPQTLQLESWLRDKVALNAVEHALKVYHPEIESKKGRFTEYLVDGTKQFSTVQDDIGRELSAKITRLNNRELAKSWETRIRAIADDVSNLELQSLAKNILAWWRIDHLEKQYFEHLRSLGEGTFAVGDTPDEKLWSGLLSNVAYSPFQKKLAATTLFNVSRNFDRILNRAKNRDSEVTEDGWTQGFIDQFEDSLQ